MTRAVLIFAAALALAACATISPKVGPVTGTINIGTSKPPIAVTTTLLERCAPPEEMLAPLPLLPPVGARRLTPKDLLQIAVEEARAYEAGRRLHSDLAEWIEDHCTGTDLDAPGRATNGTIY